jgi:hypothetical protein
LLLLRVTPAAAEVVLPLPFPFPFPFPLPLPVPELKLPLSLPFMIWACAAVAASSRNERAIKTFICELRDGYFPQNRKTYFRLVVWHSAFVLMTLGKIDHVAFLHRLTPDASERLDKGAGRRSPVHDPCSEAGLQAKLAGCEWAWRTTA